MRQTSRAFVTAAVLAAVQLFGSTAVGAESIVANGDFVKWTDGVPDGWRVEIGAMDGAEQPKSEVKPITGPALMLRGDASTMAWNSVSQTISVQPGASYSLEFESRTRDIRREGKQRNNCYVGVISLNGAGKPFPPEFEDVTADSADWTKHRMVFTVPKDAKSTMVTIFLSKSGILGVKNVTVTAAAEAAKAPGLLTNGDFSSWKNGRPDGWKISIGAHNGADQPTSEIVKLGDSGLALRGEASTMAWYSVGQEVAARKGRTYTLELEAVSENIQKQGRQFDNCYVGVMTHFGAGKKPNLNVKDLSRVPRWQKFRIDFTAPRDATKTEVLVFLSKTGLLSVKNLSVKEVPHSTTAGF